MVFTMPSLCRWAESESMQTVTHHSVVTGGAVTVPTFVPLFLETRPTVATDAAAHYLSRRPQTLRMWALTGHPIQPRRVNGRLAWPVSEIKKLLGVD